jgi:hypothetical protein
VSAREVGVSESGRVAWLGMPSDAQCVFLDQETLVVMRGVLEEVEQNVIFELDISQWTAESMSRADAWQGLWDVLQEIGKSWEGQPSNSAVRGMVVDEEDSFQVHVELARGHSALAGEHP